MKRATKTSPTKWSGAGARRPTSSSSAMAACSCEFPNRWQREEIDNIIDSKRYWIYRNLAEWRDLECDARGPRVPQWRRISVLGAVVPSSAGR